MEIEVVAPVLKVQRSSLRNWRQRTFLLSVECSAQYLLTKSWCTSLLPILGNCSGYHCYHHPQLDQGDVRLVRMACGNGLTYDELYG